MSVADAKELELLIQFRDKIKDLTLNAEQQTDTFLLRWIRARDHDLAAAEEMLRQSMIWRKENDIDNIMSWKTPPELEKLCPLEFLGFDDDNSPVFLIPFGTWDLRTAYNIGQKDNFLRIMDQVFESSLKKMNGKVTSEGNPVSQFVIISDLDRLSMRTLASFGAVDMLLQCVKRFESNHPETLKAVYGINANYVFTSLFALVKPILSPKTFGKIHIYNTNADNWKPVLKTNLPSSLLPVKYGGSCTVVTEAFAAALDAIKVEPDEEEEEVEFFAVTVPAGDKLQFSFAVAEGNSTIVWSFKTERYDIAFAVNRDEKAYIEKARVNSHEELQSGSITCDAPGDYTFTFDNSYSRLRTKALSYRIDVKTPSGKTQILFK